MIATNTAFEFLREHKDVKPEVENLVIKKIRGRVSNHELLTIFEDGISGKYGKVYSLDAQTLIDWVNKAQAAKNRSGAVLDSNLLDPSTPVSSINYPSSPKEWYLETNKAFTAYLSGVSESNFHPHIYNRLMCDIPAKIELGAMKKYKPEGYPNNWESRKQDIDKAMQLAVRDYFAECKSKGYTYIYHPKMCE